MAALGGLLVLGGIVAIVLPVGASLSVTSVVGAALLVTGLVKAGHATRCGGWRGRRLSAASAAICTIGGLVLLVAPVAMVSLTLLMVALVGADGALRTATALRIRPERGWRWLLAGGIVAVAVALLMLATPSAQVTLLGILAGIALIVEGWAFVAVALAARRFGED